MGIQVYLFEGIIARRKLLNQKTTLRLGVQVSVTEDVILNMVLTMNGQGTLCQCVVP